MVANTFHIGLTGHRPPKLGGYDLATPSYAKLRADLAQYIRFQLSQHSHVCCHTGMALGADTIWGLAILDMKQAFPGRVLLHAETPYLAQVNAWFKQSDRNTWAYLRANADFETVYDPEFETNIVTVGARHAGNILNARNHGMVNACDLMLALYDGTPSGTGNCVTYAQKQGVPVVMIAPTNYFSKK